jgi:hypothetical protein
MDAKLSRLAPCAATGPRTCAEPEEKRENGGESRTLRKNGSMRTLFWRRTGGAVKHPATSRWE